MQPLLVVTSALSATSVFFCAQTHVKLLRRAKVRRLALLSKLGACEIVSAQAAQTATEC